MQIIFSKKHETFFKFKIKNAKNWDQVGCSSGVILTIQK